MNKSISIILIRTEKGIINCALESIRKNGCSNIIMLDLDCISEIQSKLSNISTDYAMLMTEYDYDYDLIGYYESNELKAASLIVFKNIFVIYLSHLLSVFLI